MVGRRLGVLLQLWLEERLSVTIRNVLPAHLGSHCHVATCHNISPFHLQQFIGTVNPTINSWSGIYLICRDNAI